MTTIEYNGRQFDDVDMEALDRAMKFGPTFKIEYPELRVWPDVLPERGTPEWLQVACHLAAFLQSDRLGLQPWQCEPCHTHDDGTTDPDCYGRRPEEVASLRELIDRGSSRWETNLPLQRTI